MKYFIDFVGGISFSSASAKARKKVIDYIALGALSILFYGCTTWPALYHVERPPMFVPGWAGTASSFGMNFTRGPSLNNDSTTVECLQLAYGAYGSALGRWLSIRGSGMLSIGKIGDKEYGALIAVAEPAFTIPIAKWLSLGLTGETAASLEFGPYAKKINVLVTGREGAPLRASLSVGVGAVLALHFSESSHFVTDFRVFPGSFRLAYIGFPVGLHFSVFPDKRYSFGVSYMLTMNPERKRK
jgi:hypothetical protein